MSLKAKITLLAIAVTVVMIAGLSFVQMHNVVEYWLAATQEIAELAGHQAEQLLIVRLKEREDADLRAGRRRSLDELLASDRGFALLLEETMAQTQSLVEIAVADRAGVVAVSSNPLRRREPWPPHPPFRQLREQPPWRRVLRLLDAGQNYDFSIPLGAGDATPVFTIHVLVSPVLLRAQVIPAMIRVARWGAAALLAAVILVWFSTRLVARNLTHLSSVIDQIGRGESPGQTAPARAPSREFAVIESKLNVLGHQFRGAEKLRHAVETVLEGLEEAFLVFDGDGRLSLAGGPARKLLGRPLAELRGRRMDEVFPPESSVGAVLADAFRARRPLREQPVDGRLLVSLEFGPSTALVRVRDATGERQLETQLGNSVRAAGMSRILGAVAHEIKNPLNSICVRLDNLQAWANEEHPEVEQEIQVMMEEVNRLDRVVRTFLDLTRPVELNVEDVDLVDLCRDVAALLQPEVGQRSKRIDLTASPERVTVAGDHDMLKEAIINVMCNGLEAMPDGGTLRVSLTREGQDCIVRVSDSGAGMPEAVRERMFDPYFTTKPDGSGLGLPRTLRAVQLHGGAIDVQSAAGRGTDVFLRLPAKA
jgi:signal transduction histidine kinase